MKLHIQKVCLILWLIILSSCTITIGSKKKLEITKEYVFNPHWNEGNNAILIERMNPKDSVVLDVNYSNIEPYDLHNKLNVDEAFVYSYTGLGYNDARVKLKDTLFFNRDNGFNWNFGGTWYGHKETNKSEIGNLEINSWYKFSDLMPEAYYVYVYIDSSGMVHRYNVNRSNF